jgi:hypothetical protein
MIAQTSNDDCPPYFTPRGVAERIDVRIHSVLYWIASGQLRAVNVAKKPGGRPSWRIAKDDLALFLMARTPQTHAPSGRRKKQPAGDYVKYFPE